MSMLQSSGPLSLSITLQRPFIRECVRSRLTQNRIASVAHPSLLHPAGLSHLVNSNRSSQGTISGSINTRRYSPSYGMPHSVSPQRSQQLLALMVEPVRRLSTAPVVEHIDIPTDLSTILRRPDPIDEPNSVKENGSVTSATLKVGEMNRDVHFYVPNSEHLSRRKQGTLPLMIAFHGSTEHGMLFRSSSSSYAYDELAFQHGFIVAYPDAYKGNWNDARVNANFPAVTENIDDISFVSSIIRYSSHRFGTDPQRTLAIGYSNGGQFLLRMIYEPNAPNIAGIGVHCVSLPEQSNNKVRMIPSSKSRVPVVIVNSTADPVNPYEGGLLILVRLPDGRSLGDRGLHMSGLRTARVLARNWETLGVREVEKDEADDDGSPDLVRQEWKCIGRPVVRLVSMIGEGHHISVPGGSKMPIFLGPTLEKVHSPREVIAFFKTATTAFKI